MRYLIVMTCLLISACNFLYGQKTNVFNSDTINKCGEDPGKWHLNFKDKRVIAALYNSSAYIQKILGKEILENNVRLDFCESRESGYMVYEKNIERPRSIGQDTCYEFYYLFIERGETLGYFQVSIDRNGKLRKGDYDDEFTTRPELICGFKKCIDNEFKIDFKGAVAIGTKKGFKGLPQLKSETEAIFISDSKTTFVKVKYYWAYWEVSNGGSHSILYINAETGEIEKEVYIPAMPR
jgi:hypothetical protein